jgi:hypothetical protein
MKSADNLKRLFKDAELSINPDTDERVFEDVLQAQQDTQKNLPAAPESIWRITMKSPITKLATAAIVAIACLIGLSLWRGTESGIALADVLARVEQAKAFRFQLNRFQLNAKMTGDDPNKPYSSEGRITFLMSQEYGSKLIGEERDPNGGWSTFEERYRSLDNKTAIRILHKQKKYSRTEIDDAGIERMQKGLFTPDPRTALKKILKTKYESLGRSTIDGIEVEGFRTTDPNWIANSKNKVEVDVKMWVDAKTRLPVRYDFTYAWFDQMGDKIIKHDHVVLHDFQWDVVVDAAEFEPVIPDDYTLAGEVIKYPAHITEETAIQGLKLLVELLGKYPESLDVHTTVLLRLAEKSETPAAMRLKEEIKGLTDDEIIGSNKLMDFLMPIRGLARFQIRLYFNDQGPAYYGKTVTPTDADKVLMRWKVSDSEYRVIYGDLHAETVTPEKLAELEKDLPK